MAAASYDIAYMPPDHSLQSERRVAGAQPWLEPFLVKHSSFYRKHFTKDGQTKTERRASVISQAEEDIRRKSLARQDGSDPEGRKSTDGN